MDGLEEEFSGDLIVIRVNVQAKESEVFVREFGSFTPTFIFFDADGQEEWRTVDSLDAAQVRGSMME